MSEMPHNSYPRGCGFNYGVGWSKEPKLPSYLTGLLLERLFNKRAALASQDAWAHSMLVRNVRLAKTAPEKAKAVLLLEAANNRVFVSESRDVARPIRKRLQTLL